MSVTSVFRSGRKQVRVLAAASEAGSGKATVPVLLALVKRDAEVKAFLPANVLSFARQLPEFTSLGSFSVILRNQSVQDTVGTFLPDVVLVGTTSVGSLDRDLY